MLGNERLGPIATCLGRKHPIGLVRISVGLVTNFQDCYRWSVTILLLPFADFSFQIHSVFGEVFG